MNSDVSKEGMILWMDSIKTFSASDSKRNIPAKKRKMHGEKIESNNMSVQLPANPTTAYYNCIRGHALTAQPEWHKEVGTITKCCTPVGGACNSGSLWLKMWLIRQDISSISKSILIGQSSSIRDHVYMDSIDSRLVEELLEEFEPDDA